MRVKVSWSFAAIIVLILASTTATPAQCNAELIGALRSTYGEVTMENVGEILHTATCTKKRATGNFGLDVFSPEYGELGIEKGNTSTSEACQLSNYNYFKDNRRRVAYSFLPPHAIQSLNRCFGGLSLTASKLGNSVTITASYVSTTDGRNAIVRSFRAVGDSGELDCGNTIKPKDPINPGGQNIICTNVKNENITIELTTDLDSEVVKIPKTPDIEVTPYIWEFYTLNNGRNYQCKNQLTTHGQSIEIPPYWWEARSSVIPGLCLSRWGAGEVKIDGKPQLKRDRWDFDRVYTPFNGKVWKDGRIIQCKFNGRPVGEPIDTVAGHVSRRDEGRIGLCAFKYGFN